KCDHVCDDARGNLEDQIGALEDRAQQEQMERIEGQREHDEYRVDGERETKQETVPRAVHRVDGGGIPSHRAILRSGRAAVRDPEQKKARTTAPRVVERATACPPAFVVCRSGCPQDLAMMASFGRPVNLSPVNLSLEST